MTIQKGQVLNPKGRPSAGQSWGEIIRDVTNMTTAELALVFPALAEEIRGTFGEISLKKAMILRVIQSLMASPNSKLFAELMDRSEGKVPDKLEVADWRTEAREAGLDPDQLLAQIEREFIEQLPRTSDTRGDKPL